MVQLLSQAQEDILDVRFHGLKRFTELAWKIIEPSTPFIGNWHLDVMAEHLEAVYRCQINDLLINMPPRHMKSIEVAVMFPAWVWTVEPSLKWLFSSYAQSLSVRDSVKMRRLVSSPWYQERWGNVFTLTGDQNEKIKFENDKTGYRMATSVGGSNTGEGGDILVCLPYNSLIATDQGLLPIGQIVERRLLVRVLSYDHAKGSSFQDIEAYEKNYGTAALKLTLSNGLSVEGTEEHPVYVVGKGYLPLSEVPLGSRVVSHRRSVRCLREVGSSITSAHEENARAAMQSRVSWEVAEREGQPPMVGRESLLCVREMWQSFLGQAVALSARQREVLLQCLSHCSHERDATGAARSPLGMSSVWDGHQDYKAHGRQATVLLQEVCEPLASSTYCRQSESSICARSVQRAILSRLSNLSSVNSAAGQPLVPIVPCEQEGDWQGVGRTSHRLQQGSRRAEQSHYSVPTLPWGDARFSGQSEAMDYPVVVARERIATPEFVYNLRIAKNHNYFANGTLLHNCDDPHNVEERESDVMREGAIDWWSNVMSTRINNPKKRRRIVVMQRVHEHDLSGHLLDQGGWHHLNLPAEYEGGKCIVTGCVFHWDKDPRKEEREVLWKERFGKAEIQQLKKDLKEYGAAAQLQQRPAPAEGGILKRHWWKYWCHAGQEDTLPAVRVKQMDGSYLEVRAVPLPWGFDREVQSWDLAFKDLTTSSYVVGQQWGKQGPDCFLKDQVRGQFDFVSTLGAVRAFNQTHKLPSVKVVEDKANGPAIISSLRGEIPGLIPKGVTGDKHARAAAYTHVVHAGNCYLPHPQIAPWVETFINECATFPNGEYDDQVDAWSQAMDELYKVEDSGVAITPQYSARFHQSPTSLEPLQQMPSFRFWFQGLYPCCVIGQTLPSGRIMLIDCLLGDQNQSIEDLIDRKVTPTLAADYRGCTDWRDITNHGPMSAKSDVSEHHLDSIIRAKLNGNPEPGEPDFFTRLNAITTLLSQTDRLYVNPAPSPGEAKPWIHEALKGGYAYRRDQAGVISKTEPRKFHPLSSVGDAIGHGLSKIFMRKAIPPPKVNKADQQRRAKSYAV